MTLRSSTRPSAPVASLRQLFRLAAVLAVCAIGAAILLRPTLARAAPGAKAVEKPAASAGFPAFVEGLWPDARAAGVSRQTFDRAFAGVTPSPSILALTRKQAEFAKTVGAYVAGAVSAGRIAQGQAKATQWSDALARAERESGVERWVTLAIWGIETNFGADTGGESVIRALATLAHAKYRGTFFRDELIVALRILEEGHVAPAAMRGSWAGAMGHTQFMPSSFAKYAVDFDGDGRKNIWTSIPDALGSTANFLRRHGWIAGETWGYEVTLPKGFALAAEDQASFRPFSAWAQRNVARADGEALPRAGEAKLLLPAGVAGPAFLMTRNFDVIKSYNNSLSYALAVAHLGDRIAGVGPLAGRWPKDPAISATQARDMQRQLKRLGFDIGEIDGKLGEKARDAIRRWQAKNGLIPDGYPSTALLARLKRS
ncbi:MAG: lytic murein transglycosylase [Methylobacteriaceae bacterium]|nr:lytic murein transglycosylase [Methylobacteriaceae bacterium]